MAKKAKKTRASQQSGFTLIELLAVITIMGILMMVAIPAVSRTIENSRRDTFKNTAQSYVGAIKNEIASDAMMDTAKKPISALGAGYYYYSFNSMNTSGTDLMESGGKSSWGNADLYGYVGVKAVADANGRITYTYAVKMIDTKGRGVQTLSLSDSLTRSDVKTTGTAVTLTNTSKLSPATTEKWPGESTAPTWTELTINN